MKEGDSIAIMRENDTPPAKSKNTRKVAALLTCGGQLSSSSPFLDAVEARGDAGPKRVTTWMMDADKKMRFDPIAASEEITFLEFLKRYESQEWCEENPNHPIAYLRFYAENIYALVRKTKEIGTHIIQRKGKRVVVYPSGSDEKSTELRNKILSKF